MRTLAPALHVLGLVASAGALLVMLLPTWWISWVSEDPSRITFSQERWVSPSVFGYGNVLAPLAVLATAVALISASFVVVRDAWDLLARSDSSESERSTQEGPSGDEKASVVCAITSVLALLAAISGGVVFGGLVGVAVFAPIASSVAAASALGAVRIVRRCSGHSV
ncbi:hypothetical protein I8D64_02295 [Brachybacterium sp. MASK1Z-5]|uniref:DUF2975 domain-containing protein n=1 Tax=Brachybacterium halotolerans TaxID=2795215 RepID=A0ABS1B6F7_9MICO|nr:hypothetical protein [Brachybacterium halotolerans]MBK0330234.1 hypothetical protein [Brachybacterium halotolerans]